MNNIFLNSTCLITGGLGFIGSNLAIALVNLGAKVTIADALIAGYGGNLFNIAPIRPQVQVNFSDICDRHAMAQLVQGQDFIFHLAGQVSHVLSLSDPFPDIEYNIKGTTVLMEACKKHNRQARIIYTGTRGQYGPAVQLPVNEEAPTNPKGLYEISNLTAEKIIQAYHQIHGIRAVLLRLTNIYGPRAQMQHSQFGVVNWFLRQALDNEPIKIFGDGQMKRDFLYVEDCVAALLTCANTAAAYGEILNVGIAHPTNFVELAEAVLAACGSGRWEFAPFSPERLAQEPGDFYSDITKIRSLTGWYPHTSLAEGLRQTATYYRQYKLHYW